MTRARFRSLNATLIVVASLGFTLLVYAQQRETERVRQLNNDGNARPTAGDHTRTVKVGDLERRYRVYIPKNYDATKPTPVVVVYHGGGGNPESMIRLSGMNAKADEAGFLVVYRGVVTALSVAPLAWFQ